MESLVTTSTSLSSGQPSVEGGCTGSTMYRVSAVVSHTRISISGGRSSPISRSTVRDSRTTRARYSKSLYQSGGSPMIV